MKENKRSRAKIIFIVLLLVVVGIFVCTMVVNNITDKTMYSEENTTEFMATIKSIEVQNWEPHEGAIIYTEEYDGNLFVQNLEMIEDINYFTSLQEGQKIYFRINNFWLEKFKEKSFSQIISLKTEEQEIFSLKNYNKYETQDFFGFMITSIFFALLFLIVLLYWIYVHKGYNNFSKRYTGMNNNMQEPILNPYSVTNEVIFENRVVYTEDFYRELYRYFHLNKPVALFINVYLIFMFILQIILNQFIESKPIDWYWFMILPPISIIVEAYLYVRGKRLAYCQDLELNKGKPIEATLIVTENYMNYFANQVNNVIELDNIKKVATTKNYYILTSKANLRVCLKRDGFIRGNALQFEVFLRQKKLIK